MVANNKLTWNKLNKYLHDLGIKSTNDIKRAREVFELGKYMCPEVLREIFISNYRESDGKEQFKDIWFFSDNFIVEALNFIKIEIPKVEITTYTNNLYFISIETQNYNFGQEAQKDSILHIMFLTMNRFECDIRATGQNCNTLRSIFKRFIKNNIARPGQLGNPIDSSDVL